MKAQTEKNSHAKKNIQTEKNTQAKTHKRHVIGFVILECLIYVTFTLIDIGLNDATWTRISVALKLLSIALCLLYLVYNQPKNRDNHLMVLIMSLTLASDVLLLLTRHFILGLIVFISVQLLYSLRIHKRFDVKRLMVKGVLFIACLLFFMMRKSQPFNYKLMLSLGTFYALLFIMNLFALAISTSETGYNKRLFLTGLILYALCDLNVAIYNFPTFFEANGILERIYDLSALAMWFFYLPGQVALTLSVQHDEIEM